MSTMPKDADRVRREVREGYANIARQGSAQKAGREAQSGSGGGSCCGGGATASLSERLGYAKEELERLPEGADLGLSCGNPTALAELEPGETVLDLGSGAGFDCFLAGPRVGADGRVIGVDMTPDMVEKARTHVARYRERSGLDNVEFRLGEIEHLPVADASVDVVLSNCVINLSTDKRKVWQEIARVLKPGGRVAVSDVALLRPLPESVRADVRSWVGCVAGAITVDETRELLEAAGLTDIELVPRREYVQTLEQSGDPLLRRIEQGSGGEFSARDLLTSLDVRARRS